MILYETGAGDVNGGVGSISSDQTLRAQITECFAPGPLENEVAFRDRVFRSISGLVESVGAEDAFEVINGFLKAEKVSPPAVWDEAIEFACMRTQGLAFNAPYEAHMCVLPLVVRGNQPETFPSLIDKFTCLRVHTALKQILSFRLRDGHLFHPLPLAYAYTLDEFAQESMMRMHQILRSAFASVGSQSMQTAPKFISATTELVADISKDSEIINLRTPAIADRKLLAQQATDLHGYMSFKKLPEGDWISMRLMPIAVLVPKGAPAPILDGFGANAMVVSDVFSFAANLKREGQFEALDLTATPVGLYSVRKGPVMARVKIAQTKVMADLLKHTPFFDRDSLQVALDYEQSSALLRVTMHDQTKAHSLDVSLPHGMVSHYFAESLAQDLHSVGYRVNIDFGDAMVRVPYSGGIAKH